MNPSDPAPSTGLQALAGGNWPVCTLRILLSDVRRSTYAELDGDSKKTCLMQLTYHLRLFQWLSIPGSHREKQYSGAVGLSLTCPRPSAGSSQSLHAAWLL